jgi:hypothetical protein
MHLKPQKYKEQADDDASARREQITIGLLIFTVIFTGLAALEAHRLANLTRDAIAHADDAATKQHTDTMSAIGKADDANRISNLALVSAQRAFLFVTETTVTPTVNNEGQKVLRIFPKWINSGETPTKDAFISSYCEFDASKLNYRDTSRATRDIIGPKQIKANGSCDAIIPTTLLLKSGLVASLAVGAKAVYYDVFDGTHKHITEFCATFPITQDYSASKGELVVSAGGTFIYCPSHNCADDECPSDDKQ